MQKPFTKREELRRDLQAAGADVSQDTIGQALRRVGMHSRSSRKSSLLKTRHVSARPKFACDHFEKPADFWDKILWSDETKLELFGGHSSRQKEMYRMSSKKTQYQPLSMMEEA